MMGLIGAGNNPMVGMTVSVAVSIQQAADEGSPIPDNLAVNWSLWNRRPTTEEQATAAEYGFQFAIYDDGTSEEIASLPHCLKNDKRGRKTGMTCDRCKICYNKRPCGQLAIYAH